MLAAESTYLGQLSIRELPMSESTDDVFRRLANDALFVSMGTQSMEQMKEKPAGTRMTVGIAGTPKNDTAYCAKKMAEGWKQIAAAASRKEIAELTEREGFCIAFAAGVDIEPFELPKVIDGVSQVPTVNFRTAKHIAISKVEGGFRVLTCRAPA